MPSYDDGTGDDDSHPNGTSNDEQSGDGERRRLQEIPGMVPSLFELPKGCKFQDRCPAVQDKCRDEEPELQKLSSNLVRCHFPIQDEVNA